jgi:hypothetical protein
VQSPIQKLTDRKLTTMRSSWRSSAAAIVTAAGLMAASGAAADECSDAMKAVNDIKSFNTCQTKCRAGKPTNVSDAVDCLPQKCKITLTMSPQSAQRACKLGGCQLPRIVLDCPGPADAKFPDKRFRPSFLLCPVNSRNDHGTGQWGLDVIELADDHAKLGQDRRDMVMGEMAIPPGDNYQAKALGTVLSLDGGMGRGCPGCHTQNGTVNVDNMGIALKARLHKDIDPNGKSTLRPVEELAPYVIFAQDNDEKVKENVKKGYLNTDGTKVMQENLASICKCIDMNKDAIKKDNEEPTKKNFPKVGQNGKPLPPIPPNDRLELDKNPAIDKAIPVMLSLCQKLDAYAMPKNDGQGACGTTPGTFCGSVAGGGKFLQPVTGAVSIFKLRASGEIASEVPNSFIITNVDSDASAYDYVTRTLIDPVSLTAVQGSVSGNGDLLVTATGIATVNGVVTNVQINAADTGGVITFEIRNADTAAVLASGVGESGLAKLEISAGSEP